MLSADCTTLNFESLRKSKAVSDWEKKGEQCEEIVNKNHLDQSNAYEVLEERDTLVTSSEQNNYDIILEELHIQHCDLDAASVSKT